MVLDLRRRLKKVEKALQHLLLPLYTRNLPSCLQSRQNFSVINVTGEVFEKSLPLHQNHLHENRLYSQQAYPSPQSIRQQNHSLREV